MKRLANTIIILMTCFIGFGGVIFADTAENKYEPYPLIFVHGFNNTPEITDYTDLWKKPYNEFKKFFMAGNESKYFSGKLSTFQKFDYRIKSNGDIDAIASDLKNFIDTAVDTLLPGRPEKDKKVIIVAHSMGGLVTRRLLEKYPSYKDRVKRVVFVGTPHLGSPLASGIILIDRMIPELHKTLHNEYKISTPDMSPIPNKAYQDRINNLEMALYWFNKAVNWNHGIRIRDALAGYNSLYNPWAPHMQGQGVAVGEMVVPADVEANKTFIGEALKWDSSRQIYVTSQTESLSLKSNYAKSDTFLAQKPLAMPNDFKIIQGSGDSAGSRALGKAAKVSLRLLAAYSGFPAGNTLDDLENGDGVVTCSGQADSAYHVTPQADIYTVARCHLTETEEWQPVLNAIDDSPVIENMYVVKWPATPAQIVVKVKDYLLADIEITSITVDGSPIDLSTTLADFNDGAGHYKPYVKFGKKFLTKRTDSNVRDKNNNSVTLYPGEFYVALDLDTNTSHVVEIKVRNPSRNLPATKRLPLAVIQCVGYWTRNSIDGNWDSFIYELTNADYLSSFGGFGISGGYYTTTYNRAARLYKVEIPANADIESIEIVLDRIYAYRQIYYYVTACEEGTLANPSAFPLDITAEINVDYSLNAHHSLLNPAGEHNIIHEEIGGIDASYTSDNPKLRFSYLPRLTIVKRIVIENPNIQTVWISIYPSNLQYIVAQITPHALAALSGSRIVSSCWELYTIAKYDIEGIRFITE